MSAPQMEVGSAAAEAIKKVHGMNYTVGTSPEVLCKWANSQTSLVVWQRDMYYQLLLNCHVASFFVSTIFYWMIHKFALHIVCFYRPKLWFIQGLGSS